MGKGDNNARVTKVDDKPASQSNSQSFFNQRPNTTNNQPSNVVPIQQAPQTPQAQEQQALEPLTLNSTTDILLAAILKELKTQNMLKLLELQKQQEREEKESSDAEDMQDKDNARFENHRNSLYM